MLGVGEHKAHGSVGETLPTLYRPIQSAAPQYGVSMGRCLLNSLLYCDTWYKIAIAFKIIILKLYTENIMHGGKCCGL